MFERARAAGLPMLGGYDVFANYRGASVRAHFRAASQEARDPNDKQKIASKVLLPPKSHKTIVISLVLPSFVKNIARRCCAFTSDATTSL